MESPAGEALPALPPIKTASLKSPAQSASAARVSAEVTKPAAATAEEDQEPSTPTSEETRLRPPAECPPAPRKRPAPRLSAKRKSRPSSTRVCLAVPRDLSSVFRSMPMQPEKRIRAS